MIERTKLFSIPDLKVREWTIAGIKRFLPEPDDTRENPYHKSGPPMKFYLIMRVKRVERTKRWLDWRKTSQARRSSADAGVETKLDKLREYLDTIKIEVPEMSVGKLTATAVEHYKCALGGRAWKTC